MKSTCVPHASGPTSRTLHFHDLRREFACRLLESRAELHDVRDFLGHANITTTSRYLRSTTLRLERALTLLERHEQEQTRSASTAAKQGSPEKCHTGATRRVRRSSAAMTSVDAEAVD